MSGKIILFFSTLVCCSLAASETKKCQKSGAYCLNHWDCCSNTCLSFLYKCSFIPSTDIEPPSQDVPALPAIDSGTDSYESMLEDIFNPLKSVPTPDENEMNSIKSHYGEETNRDKLQNNINTDPDEPSARKLDLRATTAINASQNNGIDIFRDA